MKLWCGFIHLPKNHVSYIRSIHNIKYDIVRTCDILLYHKSSPLCACSSKDTYTLTFSLWPDALERQDTCEAG